MHRQLRQADPARLELAYDLSETASCLTNYLCATLPELHANATRDIPRETNNITPTTAQNGAKDTAQTLQRTKSAAFRTVIILLHGIAKLDDNSHPNLSQNQSSVVYHIVQFADMLLNTLEKLTEFNATNEVVQQTDKAPKSKRRSNPPARESTVDLIVTLLASLISNLDPKAKSHVAIFEGVLFHLFDRIGKHLFVFTFGHERSATIEMDIEQRLEQNSIATGPDRASARPSMMFEAQYLVTIFRRVMSMAPSILGSSTGKPPRQVASLGRSSGTSKRGALDPKSTISHQAREKLQRTLVYCMYGDEDTSDVFFERLKKPLPHISIPPTKSVDRSDVPDWFQGEVWKLIGWDILADREWQS